MEPDKHQEKEMQAGPSQDRIDQQLREECGAKVDAATSVGDAIASLAANEAGLTKEQAVAAAYELAERTALNQRQLRNRAVSKELPAKSSRRRGVQQMPGTPAVMPPPVATSTPAVTAADNSSYMHEKTVAEGLLLLQKAMEKRRAEQDALPDLVEPQPVATGSRTPTRSPSPAYNPVSPDYSPNVDEDARASEDSDSSDGQTQYGMFHIANPLHPAHTVVSAERSANPAAVAGREADAAMQAEEQRETMAVGIGVTRGHVEDQMSDTATSSDSDLEPGARYRNLSPDKRRDQRNKRRERHRQINRSRMEGMDAAEVRRMTQTQVQHLLTRRDRRVEQQIAEMGIEVWDSNMPGEQFTLLRQPGRRPADPDEPDLVNEAMTIALPGEPSGRAYTCWQQRFAALEQHIRIMGQNVDAERTERRDRILRWLQRYEPPRERAVAPTIVRYQSERRNAPRCVDTVAYIAHTQREIVAMRTLAPGESAVPEAARQYADTAAATHGLLPERVELVRTVPQRTTTRANRPQVPQGVSQARKRFPPAPRGGATGKGGKCRFGDNCVWPTDVTTKNCLYLEDSDTTLVDAMSYSMLLMNNTGVRREWTQPPDEAGLRLSGLLRRGIRTGAIGPAAEYATTYSTQIEEGDQCLRIAVEWTKPRVLRSSSSTAFDFCRDGANISARKFGSAMQNRLRITNQQFAQTLAVGTEEGLDQMDMRGMYLKGILLALRLQRAVQLHQDWAPPHMPQGVFDQVVMGDPNILPAQIALFLGGISTGAVMLRYPDDVSSAEQINYAMWLAAPSATLIPINNQLSVADVFDIPPIHVILVVLQQMAVVIPALGIPNPTGLLTWLLKLATTRNECVEFLAAMHLASIVIGAVFYDRGADPMRWVPMLTDMSVSPLYTIPSPQDYNIYLRVIQPPPMSKGVDEDATRAIIVRYFGNPTATILEAHITAGALYATMVSTALSAANLSGTITTLALQQLNPRAQLNNYLADYFWTTNSLSDTTITGLQMTVRILFQHCCGVCWDVMFLTGNAWNRYPGGLPANRAAIYALQWPHSIPHLGTPFALDIAFTRRPVEWGFSSVGMEADFTGELGSRTNGHEEWLAVEGAYEEYLKNASEQQDFFTVPYSMLAVNFITQLLEPIVPPVLSATTVNAVLNSRRMPISLPAQLNAAIQPDWDQHIMGFSPFTFEAYNWVEGTLRVAAFQTGDLPVGWYGQLCSIKKGNTYLIGLFQPAVPNRQIPMNARTNTGRSREAAEIRIRDSRHTAGVNERRGADGELPAPPAAKKKRPAPKESEPTPSTSQDNTGDGGEED